VFEVGIAVHIWPIWNFHEREILRLQAHNFLYVDFVTQFHAFDEGIRERANETEVGREDEKVRFRNLVKWKAL
jgi:hypothetical protein